MGGCALDTLPIPAIMAGMSVHIGLNAHLLSGATGYRQAGIHGYIYHLLASLPAADPDMRYTVMVGEGEPPEHPALAVRRSRWPTDRPMRRILWEQLAQPFQLGAFDLVHELAFVAPLLMSRPFVVTVYDLTFVRYPERLSSSRRLYLHALTGLSCRRARRVLAISQSTADDLVTLLHVPRARIDLAIPGIDPRFCPLPAPEIARWRSAKGLPDRFLLFVGTLEPRKNLPVLLRAYAALPEADRRAVPLVLAGGAGWMTDTIDQTIQDGNLATTVHRVGFVPDSDLVWWYNAAEALVYPSVFEGWGMPVTEAMACGKPVLVSDVSSLPEAVGDAGCRLPPESIPAWTEALQRCLHDSDWRDERGARALERAKQFTWQRTAQQTIQSYYRALAVQN
ncbi:MAG TPA: glycosyltransferase family 1 protein [Aggregatilineales bacterium]|nr:glycosyltransferase family 1 protein [Aggregatilineales bacterium]